MRFKYVKKLIKKALLMFSLISISACAGQTPPIPDLCGSVPDIIPDAGFRARMTPNEQRQIESVDEILDEKCHRA